MNNAMFNPHNDNENRRRELVDLKQMLEAEIANEHRKSDEVVSEEISSLDFVGTEEVKEVNSLQLEEKAKVLSLTRKPNVPISKAGFIDALVLAFITAVAALTSFLYMLLNINSVLY